MEENKIIAYKGFDENLCCRGFQYEIGKEYVQEGEIELWAARDKNGKLYLYRDKPIKDKFVWYSPGFSLLLASTLFPEIKWSDEEPTRVSITIKK